MRSCASPRGTPLCLGRRAHRGVRRCRASHKVTGTPRREPLDLVPTLFRSESREHLTRSPANQTQTTLAGTYLPHTGPSLPSLKPCNCAGLYSCVAAPKLAVIWGKSHDLPTHQRTGGNRGARVHTGTIGRYSWQADLAAHSRATTPATSSWGCSRSEPLTPASSSLAYTRGIWTLVAPVLLSFPGERARLLI